MKKALLIFSLVFVSLFGVNKLNALSNVVQSFYVGSNQEESNSNGLITVNGLGSYNISQGNRFFVYNVSFADNLQINKSYHLKMTLYGTITDGFVTPVENNTWKMFKVSINSNNKMPIYNFKYSGSGRYRYVEFDFLTISMDTTYILTIGDFIQNTVYYSWSGDSTFGVTGLEITKLSDQDDAIIKQQDIMINQNQTIIDQNQQIINGNNQTNNKLDDLNNNLTDETPPDTSEFGNVAGWLPAGPVDSILTLPLNVLNSISNALNGSCTKLNVPLPFIDKKLEIMCGTEFYSNVSGLSLFLNTLFTILGGVTLYKYFVYLYNWIDNVVSLKERDEKWGVV